MKKVFWILLVMILPIISRADLKDLKEKAKKALATPPAPSTSASNSSSLASGSYHDGIKFTLSEQEIQDAISWGKANKRNVLERDYHGIWGEALGTFAKYAGGGIMPEAVVHTKYLRIAEHASDQNAKYQEINPQAIEEIKLSNNLLITCVATNTYAEFPRGIHIVLKQGEKIIQPINITGKEDVPRAQVDNLSTTWWSAFTASFPESEIDSKAKSTLVIIDTIRNFEQKIALDLSKMK